MNSNTTLYSATYAKTNANFSIHNLPAKQAVNKIDYGAFCILSNILMRGCPIKMSKYLESEIDLSDHAYLPLCSKERAVWTDKTIKGGEDKNHNYWNPALIFYENYLPLVFGKAPWMSNMVLPEARFDYLGITDKNNETRSIDFFIPFANLAIEINGLQHNEELEAASDSIKKSVLRKINTEVYYIDAADINIPNLINKHIAEIQNILLSRNRRALSIYSKLKNIEEVEEVILSTYVIRFQILLLELLKRGKLSLSDKKWSFSFNVPAQNTERINQFAQFAFKDTMIWLKRLLSLQDKHFEAPEFCCIFSDLTNVPVEEICVDFDIFSRWDENTRDETNIIYIRTDYAEYDFLRGTRNSNAFYANYFIISSAQRVSYQNPKLEDLEFILSNIFDYKFRDKENDMQFKIIRNVMQGNDTIGILPTGAGKSICYQVASILQPCVNFIVCPLKSLMEDQDRSVQKWSFQNTAYISSALASEKRMITIDNFYAGKYLWVWISPERFQNSDFRETLHSVSRKFQIGLATIDEVHCMSEWGHEFRTSYLCLVKQIRELCPNAVLLGLTATASISVKDDIQHEFGISEEHILQKLDMDRPNLTFSVIKVSTEETAKEIELSTIIRTTRCLDDDNKNAVVFTKTKNNKYPNNFGCNNLENKYATAYKNLADYICSYAGGTNSYGASDKEKSSILQNFIDNKYRLMFATKAFGMGIDKPNIRSTIHYGMPGSIESLYQEAGRAGRDEDPASCYIIASIPSEKNYTGLQKLSEDIQKDSDTARRQIAAIQKNYYKYGDIANCLYFWLKNYLPIKTQLEDIDCILNMLKNSNFIYVSKVISSLRNDDENNPLTEAEFNEWKNRIEKSIYRLSILGLITDWTVDYRSNCFISDIRGNFTSTDAIMHLSKYFKKYESGFNYQNGNSLPERTVKEILSRKNCSILDCAEALVYFAFYKFGSRQLTNINDVYEICRDFNNSATFKAKINAAFSENSFVMPYLYELIHNDKLFSNWFKVIDRSETDDLTAILSRFLSDYQFNVGYNFISGYIRLRQNDYESIQGRERFQRALSAIKLMPEDDQHAILTETLKRSINMNDDLKMILASEFLEYFNGIEAQLYKALKDDVSGSLLVLNATQNLVQIGELIYDKLRCNE